MSFFAGYPRPFLYSFPFFPFLTFPRYLPDKGKTTNKTRDTTTQLYIAHKVHWYILHTYNLFPKPTSELPKADLHATFAWAYQTRQATLDSLFNISLRFPSINYPNTLFAYSSLSYFPFPNPSSISMYNFFFCLVYSCVFLL